MKIVGLIAEYNPFHNGHLFHLQESLRVTKADTAIVVMSGDFVQRGAPAIMPKRLRAQAALSCGAAAVFELPVYFCTGSAEYFAEGAIGLLNKLGIVDAVCFGSECGEIAPLMTAAEIFLEEPEGYRDVLQAALKSGRSYPAARAEALSAYTREKGYASLLNEPNNILAIEYLKALKKTGSAIRPYTIRRKGAGYHDAALPSFDPADSGRPCKEMSAADQQGAAAGQTFSSAAAIRRALTQARPTVNQSRLFGHPYSADIAESSGKPDFSMPAAGFARSSCNHLHTDAAPVSLPDILRAQIPDACLSALEQNYLRTYPILPDDFSLLLKDRLLQIIRTDPDSLPAYMDVSLELANRIRARLNEFLSFEQFCDTLKTRELTRTRISRALLHILLGIRTEDVESARQNGGAFYARLLGMQKNSTVMRREDMPADSGCTERACGEAVLGAVSKYSKVPIVINPGKTNGLSADAQKMLAADIYASSLYNSAITDKYRTPCADEYRQPPAINRSS